MSDGEHGPENGAASAPAGQITTTEAPSSTQTSLHNEPDAAAAAAITASVPKELNVDQGAPDDTAEPFRRESQDASVEPQEPGERQDHGRGDAGVGTANALAGKKPAIFKAVSVTKNFLAKANVPAVGGPKPALEAPPGPTPALRPRLVAKSANAVKPAAVSLRANGGASGPDAKQVWNRNRAAPQAAPKHLTDEELKQQYGIHLATRIQADADGKEAKWADIDDDEDDWAPETIEWNDGTKITLPQVDPAAALAEEKAAAAAAAKKREESQEKARAQVKATTTIGPNATVLKPRATLQSKTSNVSASNPPPEKPSLVSKPSVSGQTKSPWAPLPAIDKLPPVPSKPSLQDEIPPPRRIEEPAFRPEPSPAMEIPADSFERGPRELNGESGGQLFNAHSGRYEPALERRRESMRRDSSGRPPSLLPRGGRAQDLHGPDADPFAGNRRSSTEATEPRQDVVHQKQLMKEAREMAMKRKREQEEREEMEKKERIRKKLESLGPMPSKEAKASEPVPKPPAPSISGPPQQYGLMKVHGMQDAEPLGEELAPRTRPWGNAWTERKQDENVWASPSTGRTLGNGTFDRAVGRPETLGLYAHKSTTPDQPVDARHSSVPPGFVDSRSSERLSAWNQFHVTSRQQRVEKLKSVDETTERPAPLPPVVTVNETWRQVQIDESEAGRKLVNVLKTQHTPEQVALKPSVTASQNRLSRFFPKSPASARPTSPPPADSSLHIASTPVVRLPVSNGQQRPIVRLPTAQPSMASPSALVEVRSPAGTTWQERFNGLLGRKEADAGKMEPSSIKEADSGKTEFSTTKQPLPVAVKSRSAVTLPGPSDSASRVLTTSQDVQDEETLFEPEVGSTPTVQFPTKGYSQPVWGPKRYLRIGQFKRMPSSRAVTAITTQPLAYPSPMTADNMLLLVIKLFGMAGTKTKLLKPGPGRSIQASSIIRPANEATATSSASKRSHGRGGRKGGKKGPRAAKPAPAT